MSAWSRPTWSGVAGGADPAPLDIAAIPAETFVEPVLSEDAAEPVPRARFRELRQLFRGARAEPGPALDANAWRVK